MIYTIGETVIDIILKGMQPQSVQIGGSALNTSVSLGRLGAQVSFVSEIGNDIFGKNVLEFLTSNSVNTSHVLQINNKSSLALAFLNEHNDATYQFYKDLPAVCNCKIQSLQHNDIVLISSSFAIAERSRFCIDSVIANAKMQGAIVMYDPNIRKPVYTDSKEYLYIMENFKHADIVRASDEDLFHIFNTQDTSVLYKKLRKLGVKILIVTRNSEQIELFTPMFNIQSSVPEIVPVSTIGAGDTFNAGIVYALQQTSDIQASLHDRKFWESAINFASSCAGFVCCSYDNYISKDDIKHLPELEI